MDSSLWKFKFAPNKYLHCWELHDCSSSVDKDICLTILVGRLLNPKLDSTFMDNFLGAEKKIQVEIINFESKLWFMYYIIFHNIEWQICMHDI